MNTDLSILSHNRTLAFAKHAKMGQNEPFFALISYRTWHNMAKDIAMYLLNQYILSPLSSYCLSRGLVLSNLSRCILYLFVLRQKRPSSNKTLPDSSRFSNLFAIFEHRSATTAVARNDFNNYIIFIFPKFPQGLNNVIA